MPIAQWRSLFLLGVGTLAVSYVSPKAALAILATIGTIALITHAKVLGDFVGSVQ